MSSGQLVGPLSWYRSCTASFHNRSIQFVAIGSTCVSIVGLVPGVRKGANRRNEPL